MQNPSSDAFAPLEMLPESAERCGARPVPLEEEVGRLFEQLRNPLLRYLLSLGLKTQDGEEVIQEVFLALFKHLKNGRPRDNLRGWIFRVGHHQAMKARRRGGRQAAYAELGWVEANPDPDLDPEQQALRSQKQRRLAAVVGALPKQDRACLALRAEGMRYREIAEILGVSLGAVALSLGRSLSKLSRVEER